MSKKILVTGGAGFIGHHFIDYLLMRTDWTVVCMDRLDPAGDLNRLSKVGSTDSERRRLSVCFHDLRAEVNPEVAKAAISGNGAFDTSPFDYVVHMAAGSHVTRSVADPVSFVMDNVVGTAHLLDFCRKVPGALAHGGRIMYFSTDEVFGPAPEGTSYSEWDRFNPNNPYSASKAGGEALCSAYANTYSLPIMVTHTTNVFGERQHAEKFIPLLIRKILCRETVQIHADKTETKSSSRFYTYVDNISSAVLHLLEHGECMNGTDRIGKYNISGEQDVSNLDLAQLVAGMLGKELLYEMVSFCPERPKHDMRYAISDNALRATGWRPQVSFDEGMRRTISYFK